MQVALVLSLSLQLEAARGTVRQKQKALRAIKSSSFLGEKRLAVEDAKYGQLDATLAQVRSHQHISHKHTTSGPVADPLADNTMTSVAQHHPAQPSAPVKH